MADDGGFTPVDTGGFMPKRKPAPPPAGDTGGFVVKSSAPPQADTAGFEPKTGYFDRLKKEAGAGLSQAYEGLTNPGLYKFAGPFGRAIPVGEGLMRTAMSPLRAGEEYIGDPIDRAMHLDEMNKKRAQMGLSPLPSTADILDKAQMVIGGPGGGIGGARGIAAAKQVMGDASRLRKLLSPASVSAEGEAGAAALRKASGEAAYNTERTRAALGANEAKINAMPEQEQLDWLAYIENRSKGWKAPNNDPELQGFADTFRDAMKDRERRIGQVDKLAQAGMREDYVTHYWQDKQAAKKFMASWATRMGSGSSLKARSIPTIEEGIRAGLKPVTSNPIQIAMRYVTNMDRYIAMNELLETGKKAGTIKWVQAGKAPPDGYVPLNGALVDFGNARPRAHAPEDWARIWNNYVSKGFYSNADIADAYKSFRNLSNIATQTTLSLSGYHVMAMAKEAVHSDAARSISQIVGGIKTAVKGAWQRDADALLRGAKMTAKGAVGVPLSIAAPVTRPYAGHKFQQMYLDRLPASPKLLPIVNSYREAGGQTGRYSAFDYKFSDAGSFFTSWWRGRLKHELKDAASTWRAAGAPLSLKRAATTAQLTIDTMGRVMDSLMSPFFDQYIPKLKQGVFADTMAAWLEANPLAGHDEQVAMARNVLDSVDNRFGEMIHDNIMWHNAIKQTATLGMLSYSWNLGTVREIIGGSLAAAKSLGRGVDISSGHYDPRVAYVMAYPMAAFIINAAYQKLKTGQWPQTIEDGMSPRTGGMIPGFGGRGRVPERAIIPGYDKDIFGWYQLIRGDRTPGAEFSNKLNPLIRLGVELATKSDWKGDPIVRPDPTIPQWLYDYYNEVSGAFAPISLGRLRTGEKVGSHFNLGDELLGIRAAPGWLQDPKHYDAWLKYHNEQRWRHKEQFDKRQQQQYGGPQQ